MARLLPFLLLLALFAVMFFARREVRSPRSDRVFRPRWGRRDRRTGDGEHWVVQRAELAGVRDAYSSAAIDPDAPLYRCNGCQAYYHAHSIAALRAQNSGRCALCGCDDLNAVRVL